MSCLRQCTRTTWWISRLTVGSPSQHFKLVYGRGNLRHGQKLLKSHVRTCEISCYNVTEACGRSISSSHNILWDGNTAAYINESDYKTILEEEEEEEEQEEDYGDNNTSIDSPLTSHQSNILNHTSSATFDLPDEVTEVLSTLNEEQQLSMLDSREDKSMLYDTVAKELNTLPTDDFMKILNSNKSMDSEYFLRQVNWFKHIGITIDHMKLNPVIFVKNTPEDCDRYLIEYGELKKKGIENFVKSPIKKNQKLVNIGYINKQVDTALNKYGFSIPQLRRLKCKEKGINVTFSKIDMIAKNIPDHSQVSEFTCLFKLPMQSLAGFFTYVKESNCGNLTVDHAKNLLEENNFMLHNIQSLSQVTGIAVNDVRKLAKNLEDDFIVEKDLEERCELLRSYDLTNEEICQVYFILKHPLHKLKLFLTEYQELNDSGIIPWSLKDLLLNLRVAHFCSAHNLKNMGENFTKLSDTLNIGTSDITPNWCKVCIKRNFDQSLEHISIIKKVITTEEILSQEGLHLVSVMKGKKTTCKAVEFISNMPNPSLKDLYKYYMHHKRTSSKLYICRALNIKYKKEDFSEEIVPYPSIVNANIKLLKRYGYTIETISRIPRILCHNTRELQTHLELLPLRTEIQDLKSLGLNSFQALNYLQYFLERDRKMLESTGERTPAEFDDGLGTEDLQEQFLEDFLINEGKLTS